MLVYQLRSEHSPSPRYCRSLRDEEVDDRSGQVGIEWEHPLDIVSAGATGLSLSSQQQVAEIRTIGSKEGGLKNGERVPNVAHLQKCFPRHVEPPRSVELRQDLRLLAKSAPGLLKPSASQRAPQFALHLESSSSKKPADAWSPSEPIFAVLLEENRGHRVVGQNIVSEAPSRSRLGDDIIASES
jgi:hypothetical protein